MKRALLTAALAIGIGLAGTSDAQAQGLTLGVQGGYNYAQLSDVPTSISEVGDKGGLVLGAFVDLSLGEMLFLGLEGNYVEMKSDVTEIAGTSLFKQNYIQIPAVLGVRLLRGMIEPVLYAGGAAAFETKCEIEPEGLSAADCSDPLNGVDTKSAIWSAVFGGGVNVAVGPVIVNGDLRYNLGLTKISDTDDSKWNHWMALVGVGFRLGG